MTNLLRLRQYQREAVDKVQDAHAAGMNFPAVVLPTGTGKTVCFAHLAAENLMAHRGRNLVLVHRDELADQALNKIRSVAPGLVAGKVKAEDDEVFADVVVASVQTASREDRLARLVGSQELVAPWSGHPKSFGLVITDECHHAVAPSYGKIYDAFPGVPRAGFTATLARGDGVGLGSVIDDVVFTRSWLWMIGKEYLVDPVGQVATVETLDLDVVRRTGSDYGARSLGDSMIEAGAPDVVAAAYGEHAADRSGIVFMPNVASAYLTAAAFDRMGIAADVVEANTPRIERQSIYERSRTGRLQVIVNVGVLTEGFDAPWIDCVVPRITRSLPLFQQMVGRGLRLYPGKGDCLVLSIGGMSGRLRTLVDLEPGAVRQVRPGESLAEAVEREQAEGNTRVSGSAAPFRIRKADVDMFSGSRSVWLRTAGGVMFIPVADGEVFLWPGRHGTWEVRHAPRDTSRLKLVWPVLRAGLSLEMAMAWGETEAEDLGDTGTARVSSKAASWRRSKAGPTEGQLAACRAYGITAPEDATRARVSDLLSVHVASAKFDPFVTRMANRASVSAS